MIRSFDLPIASRRLFDRATAILDDAGNRYGRPLTWTLGGGTVMFLRHEHRRSRDIDVFVPDPQHLGYLSPRLSDVASSEDPEYEEGAEFVKIYFPEGEIDFIACGHLTSVPTEVALLGGRSVALETDLEIVAKKLYFRGNRFQPRDLFDLAFVLERHDDASMALQPWADRYRDRIKVRLTSGSSAFRDAFEAVEAVSYQPGFDDAVRRVLRFLDGSTQPLGSKRSGP